jgi:hypothetical protein
MDRPVHQAPRHRGFETCGVSVATDNGQEGNEKLGKTRVRPLALPLCPCSPSTVFAQQHNVDVAIVTAREDLAYR